MSHFGRKAAIAAVAFATVGSALFGGAALASDKKDGKDGKPGVTDVQDATAVGGRGGDIDDTCESSGILSFAGSPVQVAVVGDNTNTSCNPTTGAGGGATATNLLGL